MRCAVANYRRPQQDKCSQPSGQYVRKESTGKKEKKNSVDMSGRRQSMTAQITRQARRLSAAIAPQLTKVELPMLMKTPGIIIQARDHVQIENVMQNYILHNAHNFEPVDFIVQDLNKSVVLTAQVGASQVAFYECGRKVVELSFGDVGDRSNLVAKIRHPVSGMVVNELVDFDDCIVVYNNTESAGARIEVQTSSWMALLAKCGCTFASERWNILAREQKIAEIAPVTALLQESSIEVTWENFCEMDMRMVSMCFGLIQLVRKAYPPLLTIINEHLGVSAQLGCSIAWTDRGNAYAWGYDSSGQLGLGLKDDDEKMVPVPQEINSAHLEGYKIVQVSVADNHALLLAVKH